MWILRWIILSDYSLYEVKKEFQKVLGLTHLEAPLIAGLSLFRVGKQSIISGKILSKPTKKRKFSIISSFRTSLGRVDIQNFNSLQGVD